MAKRSAACHSKPTLVGYAITKPNCRSLCACAVDAHNKVAEHTAALTRQTNFMRSILPYRRLATDGRNVRREAGRSARRPPTTPDAAKSRQQSEHHDREQHGHVDRIEVVIHRRKLTVWWLSRIGR